MVLAVSILTPDKILLETSADFVVISAFDGELGILSNHAPLLTQLKPGPVCVHIKGNVEFFAVSGGFVEVYKNSVSILAEAAELAKDIDVERARQAAERARQTLRAPSGDINLAAIEASLLRALARLRTTEALRRPQKSFFTVEK